MINFKLSDELLSLIQGVYSKNPETQINNIELIFKYFLNDQATDAEIYFLKMSNQNPITTLIDYLPTIFGEELSEIVGEVISNSDYDPYEDDLSGECPDIYLPPAA
jgi:hypothetical protein